MLLDPSDTLLLLFDIADLQAEDVWLFKRAGA